LVQLVGQAETIDEALPNFGEAIEYYLMALKEDPMAAQSKRDLS
jgi:predicted RNase H-like HicB family nuclease